MTNFQWIFLTLISAGLGREMWVFWRDMEERRASSTRMVILAAAAVAIAMPSLIQMLARKVGVARGADLVLYLFTAAFLVVTFYFYARDVVLQRQITVLVREFAIHQAVPPGHRLSEEQEDRPGLRVVGEASQAPWRNPGGAA